MQQKKKTSLFTLEAVDPSIIDSKYGFEISSNLNDDIQEEITLIEDINNSPDKKSYYPYVDDKYNTIAVSMMSSITKRHLIDNIHCYWCRHTFETIPIGCPIRFIPHRIVKTFHSLITKESYNISQNISNSNINYLNDNEIDKRGYYETEGVFCSFNCCMAWIEFNWKNKRYNLSRSLLYKLYYDFNGNIPDKIIAAPDWKILLDYGGYMSIEEFRNSFQTVQFIDKQNEFNHIPKMYPIGSVLEKKSIF